MFSLKNPIVSGGRGGVGTLVSRRKPVVFLPSEGVRVRANIFDVRFG